LNHVISGNGFGSFELAALGGWNHSFGKTLGQGRRRLFLFPVNIRFRARTRKKIVSQTIFRPGESVTANSGQITSISARATS